MNKTEIVDKLTEFSRLTTALSNLINAAGVEVANLEKRYIKCTSDIVDSERQLDELRRTIASQQHSHAKQFEEQRQEIQNARDEANAFLRNAREQQVLSERAKSQANTELENAEKKLKDAINLKQEYETRIKTIESVVAQIK